MSYLKFIVQNIYKVSTFYIIDRVKSRARAAEAIAVVQPNKKWNREQCKAVLCRAEQSRHLGWHYACLPLAAPSPPRLQVVSQILRRLQLEMAETALLDSSTHFSSVQQQQYKTGSTQFSSVQQQHKTGSCSSGCVLERRPFSEKAASCLFGIFWHWIKLLGTGEHLFKRRAGFAPSRRIIKQDQRHLQTRCISEPGKFVL